MTIHNTLLATLFACSLAPLALAQTATPQPGDPQRWYQEDSTAQAQLRTLRKEIAAALAEAKKPAVWNRPPRAPPA
ncbi:Uncharacterised protein [Janthinobacterium lividum]|uniref:hypothetical protein n=1 Tax=Janthinobacterium lividum TaxID=29581 RepID=UPI000E028B4D|nr:hypothetical protein [Janthinobacterium lividum]STQ93119.1 Uncharacterised protein [Janthinobacterium lividum]